MGNYKSFGDTKFVPNVPKVKKPSESKKNGAIKCVNNRHLILIHPGKAGGSGEGQPGIPGATH